MAQALTLQGVVTITESGDYDLVLPSNGTSTQVGFPIQNEEVYIIIEGMNTGDVNLNLPKISDFNGAWNTKIYITNKNITGGGRPFTNQFVNSYVSLDYTDSIVFEGSYKYYMTSPSAFIHIYNNNFWGVLFPQV